MTVRLALAADLPELGTALARAFVDDPMTTWVLGEPDDTERVRRSAAGFFRPALTAGLRRGHCYAAIDGDGRIAGGAVWAPPDVEMLTESEGAAFGMALHGEAGEAAVERLMTLGALVGDHHPHDRPHFYLFIIGSIEKGRGIGAELLAPVLARCDADGLPAYLESSNGRNVGFYERHGFVVQWEATPAPGGPVMRGMWREPA
jgi:GNAT superfamily N-acetyltransferase